METKLFISFVLLFSLITINNVNAQWMQVSNGMGNVSVISLAVSGNSIFAGTYGVYLSTNNGTNWFQTSLSTQLVVYSLATNGNNVFAGTYQNGVYVSNDNGVNWTQTSLNNSDVWSLTVSGSYVFAGTDSNGVYLSTNNGTSWTQTSLNNRNVYSLAVNGNNIFAGTSQYGVYVSNNNGTSWIQRNEGLGNALYIRAFCILNNYIFAGTTFNSVYRRSLGELVGIQPISNEIPSQFSLSQNYPNPFNPNTKIKLSLPKEGHVSLNIYSANGQAVQNIISGNLTAGTYEADFDGSYLSSGIYFYILKANDFVQTRKMILVK